MHDSNNKITIPGFYDNVIKVSDDDRKKMNSAPFNIDEFKNSIGLKKEHGEEGYTTIERQSIRPALDVNGIWGVTQRKVLKPFYQVKLLLKFQ